MELIRGPKPYTKLENLFAAEKAKLVRAEVQAVCEMNQGLLNYPFGKSGADFSPPESPDTDGATIKSRRYMRKYMVEFWLEKRRRRIAYFQKGRA